MIGPVYAGGLYYVIDDQIRLIPDEERRLHETRRPVVVVSGPNTNGDIEWPFVLVCPVSTSTSRRTRFDVQLAQGQGGALKKCWVRVPAVQPLMKDRLGDQLGVLDGRNLSQVHTRLAQYLGLLEANNGG